MIMVHRSFTPHGWVGKGSKSYPLKGFYILSEAYRLTVKSVNKFCCGA